VVLNLKEGLQRGTAAREGNRSFHAPTNAEKVTSAGILLVTERKKRVGGLGIGDMTRGRERAWGHLESPLNPKENDTVSADGQNFK